MTFTCNITHGDLANTLLIMKKWFHTSNLPFIDILLSEYRHIASEELNLM